MRFLFLVRNPPHFLSSGLGFNKKNQRNIPEVQVVEKEKRGQIKEVSPL